MVIIAPITVGILKLDSNTASLLGNFGRRILQETQFTVLFWLIFVPVSAGASKGLRSIIGAPWFWAHVQFVLDNASMYVFPDYAQYPKHHRRATLFRYRKYCLTIRGLPWKGWLVPVIRSGHTTKSWIPEFCAPDNADKAEGVAGQAWARASTVDVSDLPDLSNSSHTEADIEKYAEKTFVSKEFVRAKLPSSRSLVGIPIEVKSEPWGVIVFDSRSNTQIDEKRIGTISALTVKTLVKLIEKGAL